MGKNRPYCLYVPAGGGQFQITKNSGPAACYCRNDVEFLCQKENIKLAKKMKHYFAPEEFFCQTLLYNSPTQRKNFLDETLCATDYEIQETENILRYLKKEEFKDSLLCGVKKNYRFEHICFLRKVSNKQTWQRIETILKGQELAKREEIES